MIYACDALSIFKAFDFDTNRYEWFQMVSNGFEIPNNVEARYLPAHELLVESKRPARNVASVYISIVYAVCLADRALRFGSTRI